MSTDAPGISLIAVAPAETDRSRVYNPELDYVVRTKTRNRRFTGLDMDKLIKDSITDLNTVNRITIPLLITIDRERRRKQIVTAAEFRRVGYRGQGSEVISFVATPTGRRMLSRNVSYYRGDTVPRLTRGPHTLASMAVEVGCLIIVGATISPHEQRVLVYRIDSIDPWSAATANIGAAKEGRNRLCLGNATLIHAYHHNTLTGSSVYTSDVVGDSVLKLALVDLDDQALRVLKNRNLPCFREFFSTARDDNERYAFFGNESDATVSLAVDPDDFLPMLWEKILEFRGELEEEREDQDRDNENDHTRVRPSRLPCGVRFTLDEEEQKVSVDFTLPRIGSSVSIHTELEYLPENLEQESLFRMKVNSFDRMKAALLAAEGRTVTYKLFTAI